MAGLPTIQPSSPLKLMAWNLHSSTRAQAHRTMWC
jgi:hypothetical protein